MAWSSAAATLATVVVLAGFGLAQSRAARLIQSADGTEDRLSDKGLVELVPNFPFDGLTVNVTARLDQEMMGFGGAFTEAAALEFWALPAEERDRLLQLYFGEGGLNYVFGRTHINSCDFSPTYYTFDDVDDDFDLQHFDSNVTHDVDSGLIPLIQAAQQVLHSSGKSLRLLATSWSPPAWMKTTGEMKGSDRPGLKDTCKASWAKYFSKWISAYKSHGVPIWAVTPQNEPENAGIWESCVFNAKNELDWIAGELGPTLKADHPEVEIFIFDHNKDHVLEWAEALYSHPEAMQYTSGVAYHWYTGDEFENVAELHRRWPDAVLISTEITYDQSRLHGHSPKDGNWDFAMGYAHEIIGDFNTGARAFLDWNLILNQNGGPNKVGNNCDAAMISDGERVLIHPQYYAIGHFSKFIVPGSRRLVSSVSRAQPQRGGAQAARPYGSCDAGDGLQATSFLRPDGATVVVALNCGDEGLSFKLQQGGDAIKATIPARGIQTYVIEHSDGLLVV